MRRVLSFALTLGLVTGAWLLSTPGKTAQASPKKGESIAILDDCDPADTDWTPIGGCTLKPKQGDVTFAEFGALAFTPLGAGVPIGHPSWRNEPSYVSMESEGDLEVTNRGGRVHTFTEVAQFGGGRIGGLNGALTAAPECATSTDVAPGDRANLTSLPAGLHKFQCCIHPWMRAAVRVK
jgi:hypothetical protein